jgi:hypothetical protein
MFDQHKCTIGDADYIINPFKGKQGLKLQLKLLKIVQPALSSLQHLTEDADQMAVLGEIIKGVMSHADEDALLSLVEELLAGVYKGTVKLDIDKEFTCNYSVIIELLKAVIMFNFKDVFSKLGIASE